MTILSIQLAIRVSKALDVIQASGTTTTYTPFASQMGGYNRRSPYIATALGAQMIEDHKAGRPLSSAMVHCVGEKRKDGTLKPGSDHPGRGFWELAQSLGYNVSNREAFWLGELAKLGVKPCTR